MVRDAAQRHLVFAAMRDEGAFVLEWVCWYRMLGFEILIAVNDCTDHSPQLLEAFAKAGWLEWLEHSPLPHRGAKVTAMRAARAHPAVARADWLLTCDADELLVLHEAEDIAGFLARSGGGFDGMALHWRVFGTDGQRRWQDRPMHRSFLRCGPPGFAPNVSFKSLVRDPLSFPRWDDHAPHGRAGPPPLWVDCEGRALEGFAAQDRPVRQTAPGRITHRLAQMNHYALRWEESYALKRGTLSATGMKDRYGTRYFRIRDRVDCLDDSALRHAARFDAMRAEAMALPHVARLHHLCCADYAARLCRSQGEDPTGDARWRHHMAASAG